MMNALHRRRHAIAGRKQLTPEERRELDRGSVLPLVLALMVIGSFAVVGLLTFASTLYLNRPPIEVRDRSFWTAKSAMDMAMTKQRQFGPDGCYSATDSIQLNGLTAQVQCTPTGNYFGTGRGRFAVITTSNDKDAFNFFGSGPTAPVKPIEGDVFINGGRFDDTTADIGVAGQVLMSNYASTATELDRYQYEDSGWNDANCTNPEILADWQFPVGSWVPNCITEPWWNYAGDFDSATSSYAYPELAPLPSYARPSLPNISTGLSSPQATIGSCNLYFPGRYQDDLVLGAGNHYFPSGVYYFENDLWLQPGAKLVAGEGRWGGCAVDAEAVFAAGAPQNHEITGKGATFLVGDDSHIHVEDASLRINRRVSTPNTRGTETIAIRSVNFGPAPTGPQNVEVPDDVVFIADQYDSSNPSCDASLSTDKCLEYAVDHELQITSSLSATYTPSSLGHDDVIVEFIQNDPGYDGSEFITDGYVFVPNAKVQLSGTSNPDYVARLTGGIVAAQVEMTYPAVPSGGGDFFVGVQDEPIQRQIELKVTVDAGNGQVTVSRATLEIHVDGSYAINGWTVDPNAGESATGTTAAATTTTTTTVPSGSTTTTSSTTTTTTSTTTTTTTTLPGPPPYDMCANNGGAWSTYFGPGTWEAEYYTNKDLSGTPVTDSVTAVDFDWGHDGPDDIDPQTNDFSARFTRQIRVPSDCTIDFRFGGDDGHRLIVDGVTLVDKWYDQGWNQVTVNEHTLTAGLHDIEIQFYENGGNARVRLRYRED